MSVDNVSKLIQYLNVVSKDPIKIVDTHGREQIVGDKITSISLNKTFFYKDTCFMCGGCCPAESNVYTESEYQRILNASETDYEVWGLNYADNHKLCKGLTPQKIQINGREISIYTYSKTDNTMYLPVREREVSRCSWCYKDTSNNYKCKIHPVRSITCIMPHLRFFHRVGTSRTSMGQSQFGRNWQLGCKVKFSEPSSEEEFETVKKSNVYKLRKLNEVGTDLNIDTYIPEVIDEISKISFSDYKNMTKQNLIHTERYLF